MIKIERTVVIQRPIDEVFRFVHDPRNDATWQTTLIEATQLEEGPLGVGATIRERRRFLGVQLEMTRQITEYEPPTRSAFKMVAGGAPLSGVYRFEDIGGATRLTTTEEVEAKGFFKMAEPIFASMVGRELDASLGHLKELLEFAGDRLVVAEN